MHTIMNKSDSNKGVLSNNVTQNKDDVGSSRVPLLDD